MGPRGRVRGRCSRSGMLGHPCNAVTTRHVILSRLLIDIDVLAVGGVELGSSAMPRSSRAANLPGLFDCCWCLWWR